MKTLMHDAVHDQPSDSEIIAAHSAYDMFLVQVLDC